MIDLRDDSVPAARILRSLRRHWIMASTVIGLVGLLAVCYAFMTRPLYRSETTVSISTQEASASGLAALASQFLPLTQLTGLQGAGVVGRQEAIARLQSMRLLAGFIRAEKLQAEIAEYFSVDESDVIGTDSGGEQAINLAARSFARNVISVREDRRTGLVIVSMTWPDPARAAKLANSLVHFADQAIRREKIQELNSTIQGLEKILVGSSQVEIKHALYQSYALTIQSRLLAEAQEAYVLRVLDPAIPSSRSRPASPNRAFIILSGMFLGAVLAVVICALADRRTARVTTGTAH
jgi:uncharacterized protein involved in exopolysaccharide biosynthesis